MFLGANARGVALKKPAARLSPKNDAFKIDWDDGDRDGDSDGDGDGGEG